MQIAKVVVFVVASVVLAFISRRAIADTRSHGFYRFLAWEAILALAVLNIDRWFYRPLAWQQLVSWVLLVISGFLVVHGVQLLRRRGRPDPSRAERPLIGFEKTTTLVTSGAYRYIRHPLYSSLLFLAWGVFFKDPSWLGGVLAAAATLALVATARVEEKENAHFFGPAYEDYRRRTRMFIPFVL